MASGWHGRKPWKRSSTVQSRCWSRWGIRPSRRASSRERAGVNHGLVHYYFGAMEESLPPGAGATTRRGSTHRQRGLGPATYVPFIDKWRTAMAFLVDDDEADYQKIWFELQAMAWSRPEMRVRVGRIFFAEWQSVLVPVFRSGLREVLGIDTRRYPVDAIVSLVTTFNEGVILERLIGVDSGHTQLLKMIERMLVRLERERGEGSHAMRITCNEGSLSGRGGFIESRGWRQDRLRGVRFGGPRRSCSCRPGRSCSRGSGRCRSPTWPGTSGWSRSTAAATAGPSARRPGRLPRRRSPRTRSPSWTRRGRTGRAGRALLPGGAGGLKLAADHPDRVGGGLPSGRAVSTAYRRPEADHALLRSRTAPTEGWARLQPALLARALPRLHRLLLPRVLRPSRTRPS